MNKTLYQKLMALLAVAIWLGMPALASGMAITTGDVNVREGPGLDHDIVATVKNRTALYCFDLEEISTDARGIDWYCLDYEDGYGWVSSKYIELYPMETEVDLLDRPSDIQFNPDDVSGYKELMDWYGKPIFDAAEALGLTQFVALNCEAPIWYYDDAVIMKGYNTATGFDLTGQGFTLYGVHLGMDKSAARAALTQAGLVDGSNDESLFFSHLVDETSFVEFETDSDYAVTVELDENEKVTGIWFDTYTG